MNSRQISSYILILLTLPFTLISAKAKEPVDYVDMFIGTSNSRWMLGPYAQEPFGMVQLGPDNQGNVWMGDTNTPSTAFPVSAICMPGRWVA